ncbi:MAG: 3-oxoacyl-ACP reductase FabG [Dehalococcoidia bacterium]
MSLLDEKVAIVTGSGRGIGQATARLLSEHGARVLIHDLEAEAAEASAAGMPGESATLAGDITAPEMPDVLVEATLERWGRVDILVNCAGYNLDAAIHKMTDEQFQRMLDIHTVAPFRMIRAVAPHFREQAKVERANGVEIFRKIVNVSSIAGTVGSDGQANYSAAKAGLIGLTLATAKEWARFRVNCNAVAPGLTDTRLTREQGPESTITLGNDEIPLGLPPAMREAVTQQIGFQRPGKPEEVAGAVFYFCTPWSNYVTGQVLTVAGGLPG